MKKTSPLLAIKAALFGCIATYSSFAIAAEAGKDTLQGYIVLILEFINFVLIPLLFSLALLFFLINAARYFIFQGDSNEGREKAKKLALYGIGAFVFLVSIWGIVNMVVYSLGFYREEAICPDYMQGNCYSDYREYESGDTFNLFDSYYDEYDDYGSGSYSSPW